MLDHFTRPDIDEGILNLQIGMAHRGRLNVLTLYILEKPYEMMISEFMHTAPYEIPPEDDSLEITQGGQCDVKYHLGGAKVRDDKGLEQRIGLANNPSHLEVVGPVVLGKARAQQETTDHPGLPEQDYNKAIAAIIHGDAAFPGQGIVYESLNLGKLDGYTVGGSSISLQITASALRPKKQMRDLLYMHRMRHSDLTPVLHVNADKPEHVLRSIEIALKYRQHSNKDIVIDLIGYRRYGHNEMDEPTTTNPLLYQEVKSHDTIELIYGNTLVEQDIITEEEKDAVIQTFLMI